MKPGPVFLDTGIFIAFLDRADHHHETAVSLFGDPPKRWYSSMAVVAEGYGWFLHRLGEQAARTFRLTLAELPRLEVLTLDSQVHEAACRTLDRFRGHKLTYVDASSLVFLARLRIAEVWGTDQDLSLDGARILPGG